MTDEIVVQPAMEWHERIGGRKFVLGVLALLLATLMAWFGKLSADATQWIFISAIGAYSGANVWQKIGGQK